MITDDRLVVRAVTCSATYDEVPEGHEDETHTCDLGVHHERAHQCPLCGERWTAKRSYHANHPFH